MNSTVKSFALGSFCYPGRTPFLGVIRDDRIQPLFEIANQFPAITSLFDILQDWDTNYAIIRNAVLEVDQFPVPLEDVTTCAPLPQPRQIFCTGANYRDHVVEMVVALSAHPGMDKMTYEQKIQHAHAHVDRQAREANPYVFLKPVGSVCGPYDDLVLPKFSKQVDWELELGVVLGKTAFKVSQSEAKSCIAGYMIVNDITARDKVKRTDPGALGPDWIAAKGLPGFLPTGPYFVPAEFVTAPADLAMQLLVNGETMQVGRTSGMTFSIDRQIEFISQYARMLPGDLLCTGSPAGNGVARGIFLNDGDVMVASIEGLGQQQVRCVEAAS
jgi:2-keto-4-pentenoate hydratase/2-oxohepta-3-ene-1,7-dioic acid hydratase in catechol pathway